MYLMVPYISVLTVMHKKIAQFQIYILMRPVFYVLLANGIYEITLNQSLCGFNFVVIFLIMLLAYVWILIILHLHCHIENPSIEDTFVVLFSLQYNGTLV